MLTSSTLAAPNRWRQMLRGTALALAPRRALVASVPSDGKTVCLTFDDGPDSVGTPRVLDALREAGAVATFFLIGRNAQAHPELIRRIRDDGHEIGHHSWSHRDPARTSSRELADEVRQTQRFLKSALDVDPTVVRPPLGKLTVSKLLRLWALGQTVVLWAHDPGDVFQDSSVSFLAWIRDHPPQPGDIVLLHDRAPVTFETLPQILESIQARGLRFATVSQMLNGGGR